MVILWSFLWIRKKKTLQQLSAGIWSCQWGSPTKLLISKGKNRYVFVQGPWGSMSLWFLVHVDMVQRVNSPRLGRHEFQHMQVVWLMDSTWLIYVACWVCKGNCRSIRIPWSLLKKNSKMKFPEIAIFHIYIYIPTAEVTIPCQTPQAAAREIREVPAAQVPGKRQGFCEWWNSVSSVTDCFTLF